MVKTRTLILILVLALLLFAALAYFLLRTPAQGHIARVYVDGELWLEADLDAVRKPSTVPLETPWGKNTLEIEPGRIRVSDADCPDGICVQTGWTSDSALPIVCLPHRLVIVLESEEAVADTAAR